MAQLRASQGRKLASIGLLYRDKARNRDGEMEREREIKRERLQGPVRAVDFIAPLWDSATECQKHGES